jgi:hypothetical protein
MYFFLNQPNVFDIQLNEIGSGRNELYEANLKLPLGSIREKKILFCERDKTTYEKEVIDFNKNEVTILTFPEPLLAREKEKYIRLKESLIRNKEINLKESIRNIENKKISDEYRLRKIDEYLQSIPYTLEEIYEYVKNEIQFSEKDIIELFCFLEANEFLMFRKLYEIFSDYCKYYDDNANQTIDFEAMMNFFKNYFEHKMELKNLIPDFHRLYGDRYESNPEITFKDFLFIIIHVLYGIQKYKDVTIQNELQFCYTKHEEKLKEDFFLEMYKNDLVIFLLTGNITFLRKLFESNSQCKYKSENYFEMSYNKFLLMAQNLKSKTKYDYLGMVKDVKFLDDINYFDFMEKIVAMALRAVKDEEENDTLPADEKVGIFLDSIKFLHDGEGTENTGASPLGGGATSLGGGATSLGGGATSLGGGATSLGGGATSLSGPQNTQISRSLQKNSTNINNK